MLWVRISIRARCTTLCDKVWQWLVTGQWFSLGAPVSSTNKIEHHDITEILLKVALNTTNKQTNTIIVSQMYMWNKISHYIVPYKNKSHMSKLTFKFSVSLWSVVLQKWWSVIKFVVKCWTVANISVRQPVTVDHVILVKKSLLKVGIFCTIFSLCHIYVQSLLCQWLATSWWFFPGPSVSSTNKTDHHDVTEILLKVALNTIKQTNKTFFFCLLARKPN